MPAPRAERLPFHPFSAPPPTPIHNTIYRWKVEGYDKVVQAETHLLYSMAEHEKARDRLMHVNEEIEVEHAERRVRLTKAQREEPLVHERANTDLLKLQKEQAEYQAEIERIRNAGVPQPQPRRKSRKELQEEEDRRWEEESKYLKSIGHHEETERYKQAQGIYEDRIQKIMYGERVPPLD